jgi:uncharacterized protein (TIGR02118 family)
VVQMTVLYRSPADPAAFYDYYFATHVPIAKRLPGLRSFMVSDSAVTHPDGTATPYALVATLSFDSPQALNAALGSPEGGAAVNDLANFATGGVTILTYDVREV